MVNKDEIRKEIWRDAFVEEGSLAVNIFALRKALCDSSTRQEFIRTVTKRGYCFEGEVKTFAGLEPPPEPVAQVRYEAHSPAPPMIVVLGMQNLTGDPEMEFISDGFTDAIICRLARVDSRKLSVIARTSAMTYKGTRKTIREIASELRANYAIESSLRRSGGRVSIAVQLVRADLQTYVWTKAYDGELQDLFDMQHNVAQAVADEIIGSLAFAPNEASPRSVIVDPAAHELYLKGRYFSNQRSADGLQRGIEYFERALVVDPNYAPAQSGLASAWVFCSVYGGLRPGESFPRAKACALRALDLDGHLAEARSTLGMVYCWYEFDWGRGEHEFMSAIDQEPGNAIAHSWYAFFLGSMRRHEEAAREIRIALRLDPLSWAVRTVFGFLEEWAGRGQSAIAELEKTLELNPGYHFARMILGYLNMSILGRAADAISHLRQACEDSGRQPDPLSALGCVYAAVGMRREALEILEELRGKSEYVSAYFLARIQVSLNDFDLAFRLLDQAFEERFFWLMMVQNDPAMRPLTRDPRFESLRVRMAFPDARAKG